MPSDACAGRQGQREVARGRRSKAGRLNAPLRCLTTTLGGYERLPGVNDCLTRIFMAQVMQKPFFCTMTPVDRGRYQSQLELRGAADERRARGAVDAQLAVEWPWPSRKRTSGGVWRRTWRAELRKHVLPRFWRPAPTGCLRAQPTDVSTAGKAADARAGVGESVEVAAPAGGARGAREVEATGEPLVEPFASLAAGVAAGCERVQQEEGVERGVSSRSERARRRADEKRGRRRRGARSPWAS